MHPARAHILACLLLVGLMLAAFSDVTNNEFFDYDDPGHVLDNPHVLGGLTWGDLGFAFTSFRMGNWHPLTWLSLQLDAQLYGRQPMGYHLTNLLLHLADALLLYAALYKLTGAVWRSFLVAALFAVHPLHVESVAWVAERKDVLSALFWFATMAAYALYAGRPSLGRYLAVLALMALGLASKPMVVTLPCVLLLLDYWPLRRLTSSSVARVVGEKLPLFALAAAASVVTVFAQRSVGALGDEVSYPLPQRLANAAAAYVLYLARAAWPAGLAPYYPHLGRDLTSWKVTGACLLLGAITALVLWQARRRPYLLVGWLWYLGTLVPVIGLVQVGGQGLADRYTYIPLVGIFLTLVWGGAERAEHLWLRGVALAGAGAMLVALVLVTRAQVGLWHDSVLLWQHTVDLYPSNPVAHNNLGASLAARNRQAEAVPHFRKLLQLTPENKVTHYNLALALATMGKPDEALPHFGEFLKYHPENAPGHFNFGVTLERRGRVREALEQFSRTLEIDPGYEKAHYSLAVLLERQGRPAEALPHYREAVRLNPGEARYRWDLAKAAQGLGEMAEAGEEYERARRLDPNWPAHFARNAWVLATHPEAKARNGPLALKLAQEASTAAGNGDPVLLDALAAALAECGQFREAVATLRHALTLAVQGRLPQMVPPLEERLKLYQAGQPFRDQRLGKQS